MSVLLVSNPNLRIRYGGSEISMVMISAGVLIVMDIWVSSVSYQVQVMIRYSEKLLIENTFN